MLRATVGGLCRFRLWRDDFALMPSPVRITHRPHHVKETKGLLRGLPELIEVTVLTFLVAGLAKSILCGSGRSIERIICEASFSGPYFCVFCLVWILDIILHILQEVYSAQVVDTGAFPILVTMLIFKLDDL